jgi:hypothetical protein
VTHEYTILTGGVVVPGGDTPPATAIAWAADTILAIGSDDEVRAISRGDSVFVALDGRRVVAADEAILEVGGPADLRVLARAQEPEAVVRAGLVVEGALPGSPVRRPACAD